MQSYDLNSLLNPDIPNINPVNTVIKGDCVEVMNTMEPNSINLVFTSPPYNTGGGGKCKGFYLNYKDNLTPGEYYNLLNFSLKRMLRVCDGLIFINLNYMNRNKKPLYHFIANNTEYLKEHIIWKKDVLQPPMGNILAKRYEHIFVFSKNPTIEINNFRTNKAKGFERIFGSWISNLIELPADDTEYSDIHKACFPTSLPGVFISIYSKLNDIILDPFCGVGSTLLAARQRGRRYIGIDIEAEYCKISRQRLSQGQLFKEM